LIENHKENIDNKKDSAFMTLL